MVGGRRHAPAALPPGRNRYPLYRRLGGLQGRSGRVRKISPPPGFDPRTVQPVASHFTDWAFRADVIILCVFYCHHFVLFVDITPSFTHQFIFVLSLQPHSGLDRLSWSFLDLMHRLKPSSHYMYRTVVTICTAQWSLYVRHNGHYMYRTVFTVCTAQWSLYVPHSGHCMYRTVVTVCTAQWSLYVPHSVHCMYHHFNIQQFHVLPTQCIYVFCVDLRTNSHYFPIQH